MTRNSPFSLTWLLTLILAPALFMTGCLRPPTGDYDPKGLIFDEDSVGGYQRLKKLQTGVEGVRVLAWNVAWGSLNRGHEIDHNLKELVISRSRPDVIVLTEFKPSIFKAETKALLDQEYPYQSFAPYGEKGDAEVGVKVYSLVSYTQSAPENLDWTPPDLDATGRRAYRKRQLELSHDQAKHFDRPYFVMTASVGGTRLSLVPVHLLMPWQMWKERFGERETMKQIYYGKANPLYYQIQRLQQKLRRDFGDDYRREKFILIGDFNAPRGSIWTSATYDLVSRGLQSVFLGFQPTFPTFSAEDHQKPPFDTIGEIMIDHAFVSPGVELSPRRFGLGKPRAGAAMIRLRGSDHYPIYVVIDPT